MANKVKGPRDTIFVGVWLEPEQDVRLQQLVNTTGWNRSELLRRLIDAAWVRPSAVAVTVDVAPEEGSREIN